MTRTYGSYDTPEDPGHCIESVWKSDGFCGTYHQCSRNRGHGINGLYCKLHDPERVAAKRKARLKEWQDNVKQTEEARKRRDLLLTMAEGIPTDELDRYVLVEKPQ